MYRNKVVIYVVTIYQYMEDGYPSSQVYGSLILVSHSFTIFSYSKSHIVDDPVPLGTIEVTQHEHKVRTTSSFGRHSP